MFLDYNKRKSLISKKNLYGEDAIEAVKQNGDALQYVEERIFRNTVEEMTLSDVCKELGRDIRIVK